MNLQRLNPGNGTNLLQRSGVQKRAPINGCLMAGCVLAVAVSVFAQAPSNVFLNEQRRIDDEVREALDRELPTDQKVDFDYGAWYGFHLFVFDDGIESSRTFRQHDLRPWGSLSLDQGAHQFYGRLKLGYDDWNHGDAYTRNEDDFVGPNLDRGFYQFDLRQAAKAYCHERLDYNLKVKVGRDLMEFGTGYALSLPMDHVKITAENKSWEWIGLIGKTIRSTDDIDQSRPNGNHSERVFWGGQLSYIGLEKHKPFAYFFWNEDELRESPPDFFQNYDYDTYYLGLGSTGELLRNLRYATEWVFEGGRNYRTGWLNGRDDVRAWAFDQQLEYLTQWAMKPRFQVEYMFASGDADRRYSPTDTQGGNTSGPDDSFSGFGYRDTGLSFGPRLSNVHIWRAGASFLPFEKLELLRKLELGTDWFLYAKNHGQAAVSDTTADDPSGYLGWEMDYFADWRITSDLSWTSRLGTFFPGQAFSDQTTRTFALVGVVYSF